MALPRCALAQRTPTLALGGLERFGMTSNDAPRVILSAFADEAANQKTAVQQFSALAALGLQYYSIRFIDAVPKSASGKILRRILRDQAAAGG